MDQPASALVKDLSTWIARETLVVFGGEFGRHFGQGKIERDQYGRDHHLNNTTWMAGGGIRGGMTAGQTDDFSYNIVQDPVHVTISMPRSCINWGSTIND